MSMHYLGGNRQKLTINKHLFSIQLSSFPILFLEGDAIIYTLLYFVATISVKAPYVPHTASL